MRKENLKYFSELLKEFQEESDRGAALVGGALIDSRLKRILISHLINSKIIKELFGGANAPLGSLSSRIKLCFCLGLITELEYKEVNYIRKIRNGFARQEYGLKFSDSPVCDYTSHLRANTPDGKRFSESIWQRNYYEYIVRDEQALVSIRYYIVNNPAQ